MTIEAHEIHCNAADTTCVATGGSKDWMDMAHIILGGLDKSIGAFIEANVGGFAHGVQASRAESVTKGRA